MQSLSSDYQCGLGLIKERRDAAISALGPEEKLEQLLDFLAFARKSVHKCFEVPQDLVISRRPLTDVTSVANQSTVSGSQSLTDAWNGCRQRGEDVEKEAKESVNDASTLLGGILTAFVETAVDLSAVRGG